MGDSDRKKTNSWNRGFDSPSEGVSNIYEDRVDSAGHVKK